VFDLVSLIKGAGYLGVLGIVYAETGLLIGMFLPGDSLLFTAGFLASQGFLNIALLCAITGVGAVLGDNTGYWLGRRFGPTVFSRKDSLLFDSSYLEKAEHFYATYGSKTLVLARFIPVIRTIAPTMAGVGRMRYAKFLSFSILAAVLWGIGLPISGYYIGSVIPGVDRYIIPIVLLIIVVSVAPGIWHLLNNANSRTHLWSKLKQLFRR
jgi:membrane-associated protein